VTHIVLFEDNPRADPAIRQRHMADHLAFLEAHADVIRSAGPLQEVDGSPAGGLWIVERATREEVEGLVHADPFWPTGLRKSVRILAWSRVFENGRPAVKAATPKF